MKTYLALFQGDDVLLTIQAEDGAEARKIFNRQIKFKVLRKEEETNNEAKRIY